MVQSVENREGLFLSPENISSNHWCTMKCNSELESAILERLTAFDRTGLSTQSYRRAAVALVVVDYLNDGQLPGMVPSPASSAALIITRRSGKLKNHSGQWALPGGSIDPGETPAQAALRELSEEIGLQCDEAQVLGLLDDYITRSGFHITPVVIWGGSCTDFVKSDEVASIHRVPCQEMLREDAPILERGETVERPILYMPMGNSCIAAPTAAILYQFREVCLLDQKTRVAHFDQPIWAWR